MISFRALSGRYQPLCQSLAATYLWFGVFVAAFVLIIMVPNLFQPVIAQYEIPFNAPADNEWSLEGLTNQLHDIGEGIVVIRGSEVEGHKSDHIITWNATGGRNQISPDPYAPRVYAALSDHGLQAIGGMSMTLSPARGDISLSRATSLIVWLPVTVMLMAFFIWQNRTKNAISQPTGDANSLKAVMTALVFSLPLAPVIGLLIGWASPETVDRMPSIAFSIQEWQTLIVLIVLIPLAEEIVFRSWLLERMSQTMTPGAALLISAVAFSAVHPMGLIANFVFLVLGLAWGYLWLRFRSLIICTLAHGAYNATAILIASFQFA